MCMYRYIYIKKYKSSSIQSRLKAEHDPVMMLLSCQYRIVLAEFKIMCAVPQFKCGKALHSIIVE